MFTVAAILVGVIVFIVWRGSTTPLKRIVANAGAVFALVYLVFAVYDFLTFGTLSP